MKVIIKNLQSRITLTRPLLLKLKQAIRKTCRSEKLSKDGEITLCLVNNRFIQKLNLKYLASHSSTDVMAFNLSENKKNILADIVISTDKAITNAKIYKTSRSSELYLYAIHGMLHILGYRDKTLRERSMMHKKSDKVLATITKYDVDRKE